MYKRTLAVFNTDMGLLPPDIVSEIHSTGSSVTIRYQVQFAEGSDPPGMSAVSYWKLVWKSEESLGKREDKCHDIVTTGEKSLSG